METPVIAIDLGTSRTCVAFWNGARTRVIPNGCFIFPSVVALDESDVFVGDMVPAFQTNKSTLIPNLKFSIGKDFCDISFQSICKRYGWNPFTSIDEPRYDPSMKTARNFYSLLFARIKRIAENFIGRNVEGAVICVPCIFGIRQREETAHCAQIAGFNQVRLVSDCVAISINRITLDPQNILIIDFGCGYTSTMVSCLDNTIFETLSVHGSEDCSGQRMDYLLCDYLERTHNLNIPLNSPTKRKWMEACREAKERLSIAESTIVNLTGLKDEHLTTSLTREDFLNTCKTVFQVLMDCVKQAKRQSNKKKEEFHQVLLSGGSSKIPHVTHLLKIYFGRDIPITFLEHGVIEGASLLATRPKDLVEIDVLSHSIGVEFAGGLTHFLFRKGTSLPCKTVEVFTTYTDSSRGPSIALYEGEAAFSKDNKFVNRAEILGVRPAPRGVPQIELTFSINQDGIFTAIASERGPPSNSLIVIWERPSFQMKDREDFRKQYGRYAQGKD